MFNEFRLILYLLCVGPKIFKGW